MLVEHSVTMLGAVISTLNGNSGGREHDQGEWEGERSAEQGENC